MSLKYNLRAGTSHSSMKGGLPLARDRCTAPGCVNRNGQMNLGRTDPPRDANDNGQKVYVMRCLQCGMYYGANGTEMFQRRCPCHQKGKSGLPLGR